MSTTNILEVLRQRVQGEAGVGIRPPARARMTLEAVQTFARLAWAKLESSLPSQALVPHTCVHYRRTCREDMAIADKSYTSDSELQQRERVVC